MKSLKQQLLKNELTIGSWITLAHPAIAEIFSMHGFSWLAVDLEHSVITLREAEELIRVISLSGKSPLVRLSSNDSVQIKRMMDAGSHGVIVPMVNSAADAKKAVEAVQYPVAGKRGVGLARAQKYGVGFDEYRQWLVSEAVVIAQIEHIDAVKNLEEIFSVPGIDGYIIGPYDLSASMGIPGQFEHLEMAVAMQRIKEVASKFQKPGGVHIIPPDPKQLQSRIAEGFKFLAYSIDFMMLQEACKQGLSQVCGKK